MDRQEINILYSICPSYEHVQSLSRVRLFVPPWTVTCQAPLSMEFRRQEYWSGLPFLSPEDLPNPGIKPTSPHWQVDSFPLSHQGRWNEIAQSCPILCDPIDCSLPGSSVHGIFQAIVLEWIAISFSRGSSQPRARARVSRILDRRFTVWATRETCTVKYTEA